MNRLPQTVAKRFSSGNVNTKPRSLIDLKKEN